MVKLFIDKCLNKWGEKTPRKICRGFVGPSKLDVTNNLEDLIR